ncbi:MAG: DUF4153 domain-containing protein [Bacteroidia bacterium]|nr:DUF4153 domain-containing protein [Bacteroidia bacterium]
MKFPSFEQITHEALRTLRRFPFVLLAASTGTVMALLLANSEAQPEPLWAFRVLLVAVLAVPFLTGLTLLAEKQRWSRGTSSGTQIGALILLAGYALTLPDNLPIAPQLHIIRFFMLAVALHLFVAIAPWLRRGQVNGFWHFNKTLFLRLLTAGLFTVVLWAGLAIALAAVENLFDVTIHGKRYFQLWIMLLGLLNTWFFLAGVPEDLDALDQSDDYPKGLKIFSQYVLLPLIVIYLVILVAYTGKIMVGWTWPHGWIARLILGFSVAGMFALLLLHPIREREGSRWIALASRWFYIVLAPFVVVYFLAVLRRLSDYGMTESRYIAVVTGVWLGIMVLYFVFSKAKSIKAIPLTLCAITLLVSFGPWGAFSISESSQAQRLKHLLEANSMLDDGSIRKATKGVPREDAREISAVLQYLHEIHGYTAIESWFDTSLRADSSVTYSEWKDASTIAADLGIQYIAAQPAQSDDELRYESREGETIDVQGYDRMFPGMYYFARTPKNSATSDHAGYSVNGTLDTLTFVYTPPDQPADTLRIALDPALDSLKKRYENRSAVDVPLEYTAVQASGNTVKVKVYTPVLRLEREDGIWKRTNMRVTVLYGAIRHTP